ncbi:MAG: hypothetical protein CMLOHMNK_00689 [Steroidobacteraceae bacterium]|nr:hypothetical protein [Steroidobacteraceae bacterium]
MRVSFIGAHERMVDAIMTQQATLAKIQQQVALGRRVNTPADDPVAAVRILDLEKTRADSAQFGRNADIAKSRLQFEEQALADAGNVLDRVRELLVEANSAAVDDRGRAMIASEVEARIAELEGIANRRDAGGEYLFAGFSTLSQPFVRSGSSVIYQGDDGVRLQQVGPSQTVADSHPGRAVFGRIAEGNGTFVVGADPANTGSATLSSDSVVDAAAWVPGDYRIVFTSGAAWEVRDAASTLIAGGAYDGSGAIEFNGARIVLSGQPVAGDAFDVRAAGTEDIFTTLGNAVAALRSPTDAPAARMQWNAAAAAAIRQFETAGDHFLDVRADVGARLAVLDAAAATRADLEVELDTEVGKLRDVDYAEAVSRMTRQYTALQAAQQSYVRYSQLSLFDYL